MKWFSSDRSEGPRTIAADVSSGTLARMLESARQNFNANVDEPTMREVLRLIQKRQKIEAIKVMRMATRQGLKESKDVVDHLEDLLKKA
ncbi:MAG: ribosomal protein L7/L12 [Acidobacteriota bacterium]